VLSHRLAIVIPMHLSPSPVAAPAPGVVRMNSANGGAIAANSAAVVMAPTDNGGVVTGYPLGPAADGQQHLLFFDTFSHEDAADLNLDLVQFSSPVVVDEVRVIPLGASVSMPHMPGGGMRLGATNPTSFKLDFFVNDLSKPGSAAFESLGTLMYSQHQRICLRATRGIPTDGLVLRGTYSTITLAVYGSLSKPARGDAAPAQGTADEAIACQHQADQSLRAVHEEVANHTQPPIDQNLAMPVTNGSRQSVEEDQRSCSRSSRRTRSRSPYSDRRGGTLSPVGRESRSTSRAGSDTHRSSASRRSQTPQERSFEDADQNEKPMASDDQHVAQEEVNEHPAPADDLLEEMSDISDGDIPEVSDAEGVDEAVEEPERAVSVLATPVTVEATEVPVRPEDVEEISDEEAEWSDDGMDMDYGHDWEEPVREFDFAAVETAEWCGPEGLNDRDATEMARLLDDVPEPSSGEWIGLAESLTDLLCERELSEADVRRHERQLRTLVAASVDWRLAMAHEIPTNKTRHIKAGLNFVRTLLSCCHGRVVRTILPDDALNQMLSVAVDGDLSHPMRVVALRTLDESLMAAYCDEEDDWMAKAYRLLAESYRTSVSRVKQSLRPIMAKMAYFSAVKRLTSMANSEGASVPLDAIAAVERGLANRKDFSQPLKQMPVGFSFAESDDMLWEDGGRQVMDLFQTENVLGVLFFVLANDDASKEARHCALRAVEGIANHRRGWRVFRTRPQVTDCLVRFLFSAAENASTAALEETLSALAVKIVVSVVGSEALDRLLHLLDDDLKGEDDGEAVDALQVRPCVSKVLFSVYVLADNSLHDVLPAR